MNESLCGNILSRTDFGDPKKIRMIDSFVEINYLANAPDTSNYRQFDRLLGFPTVILYY